MVADVWPIVPGRGTTGANMALGGGGRGGAMLGYIPFPLRPQGIHNLVMADILRAILFDYAET